MRPGDWDLGRVLQIARGFYFVPYLAVVVFGTPRYLDGRLPHLVAGVAVAAVATTAIWYWCDATFGPPVRWLLAMCLAVSFSIGWWSGVAGGGTWQSLPVLTTAVGYFIAAGACEAFPPLRVPKGLNAPVSNSAAKVLHWALWSSWLVILAVAIPELAMSTAAETGEQIQSWVREQQTTTLQLLGFVASWFDGVARVGQSAWWTIPCMILVIASTVWRVGRSTLIYPPEDSGYTVGDAVVIGVATLGLVLGVAHQWTLFVLIGVYVGAAIAVIAALLVARHRGF